MGTRSNLTWRTFGLSMVGLCLACTHAALAGPTTTRASYSSTVGPARPPMRPASPSGSGRGNGSGWRGVGTSSIATYTSGGGGSGSVSTFTNKGGGARVVTFAAAPAKVYVGAPALMEQRKTVAQQTRRIEELRETEPVVAKAAPEKSREQTPDRPRDPRVAAALRPVIGGSGALGMRDPFR